ncbi:MAG: BolA family transcriptional regulator [Chlamydiia bacterium]|nr:BolA family transcriptional regulator [Chlamydiia bacterium]
MAIAQEKLENILRSKFPNAKIKIVDLVGDQDHYSVEIEDSIFLNKSLIQQHKIVNESLREELKGELHAMQLKTLRPK